MKEIPRGNYKTKFFEVINNRSNDMLGYIQYYAPWRQYVFSPYSVDESLVFSTGCLADIQHFINELMKERKEP
jgi:hypothetical protein